MPSLESDLSPVVVDDDENLELPSEEELATLLHVSDSLPWTAYMITVVGLAEYFLYYGASTVYVIFIQPSLPPGSRTGAGGIGLSILYQFWICICLVGGAYIADTHWGRYKTVCWSVALAMLGHVIMIISTTPNIGKASLGLFILSLTVTGTAAGGISPNILPLVAEQCRRTRPFISITQFGERVIIDPALTTSRIYVHFYLLINIGALVGRVSMDYAEWDGGYWLAYTLPAIAFSISLIFLSLGHGRYRGSPPTDSVLGVSFHLWRYALSGRWSWNPVRCIKQLTADDFWESAKPSNVVGEKPKWMKFDDNWVDEVRRGFKACSVFLWYPIYWFCYNQLNNNLTSQAATMNVNGLPDEVLSNLRPLALIIFIPIFDLLIYPALARWGWKFTPLKRITWGFGTGCASMIWAAVVQHYIYKRNPCGYYAGRCTESRWNPLDSPLNVWIQTGSYVLIAFSEIFASITGLEYAFTKAPKNMRSLVMSVFLLMSALASAIGEAFIHCASWGWTRSCATGRLPAAAEVLAAAIPYVAMFRTYVESAPPPHGARAPAHPLHPLSTNPSLVWNYGSVGILAGVTGIVFWFLFRKLDKEEDKLNNLPDGQFWN